MRTLKLTLGLAISLLAFVPMTDGQQAKVSDTEYIAQALSAAPRGVAQDAAVVRVESHGKTRTLRKGTNGFTCMVMGTGKMCNDANAMEFFHALMNRTAPPDKIGISYMLAGDKGGSDTDPLATGKTDDNHWIVTGPHIMILGPGGKALGYTEAKDPDPSKPYMDVGGYAVRACDGSGEVGVRTGELMRVRRCRVTPFRMNSTSAGSGDHV